MEGQDNYQNGDHIVNISITATTHANARPSPAWRPSTRAMSGTRWAGGGRPSGSWGPPTFWTREYWPLIGRELQYWLLIGWPAAGERGDLHDGEPAAGRALQLQHRHRQPSARGPEAARNLATVMTLIKFTLYLQYLFFDFLKRLFSTPEKLD